MANNNAAFVSQTIPTTMTAGASVPITVVMKNTGASTWSPVGVTAYALGSQDPQDSAVWGMGRIALTGPVVPGASATFNANVIVPATPGTYPMQWQMVEETVEWFGTMTPVVQVSVTTQPPPPTPITITLAMTLDPTTGAITATGQVKPIPVT